MVTYPENIMQALQANGISCSCDKSRHLVYVLYEGHFGEIYSIYSRGNRGGIDNFTLYPFCVPESCQQEAGQYLARLNKEVSPANFYIDPETGCIAFHNQYRNTLDAGGDAEDIAGFCLETHKSCINYQVALYMAVNKWKGHCR